MTAFSGAGHLRYQLPGAAALEQVEKLRMEMLNLAPPHLCSGWDPLVPGCRSPGLEDLPALSIGASAPGL